MNIGVSPRLLDEAAALIPQELLRSFSMFRNVTYGTARRKFRYDAESLKPPPRTIIRAMMHDLSPQWQCGSDYTMS
jgi:hypothetical protein